MLRIEATWSEPIHLVLDDRGPLIYDSSEKDNIPRTSGAYIFARQHGEKVAPLYIGETQNLWKRLDEHLKKDVALMQALKQAPQGKRIFLYCEPRPKRKVSPAKARKILQDALIEHALSEGHHLVNKHGTKVPVHTIDFSGNRVSEKLAPRQMYYR